MVVGPATFSLIRRPLPPQFELRIYFLASGSSRAYSGSEWRGALVVVEYGELVLRGRQGAHARLVRGEMTWLADLQLDSLYNPGPTITLFASVARQDGQQHEWDPPRAAPPS